MFRKLKLVFAGFKNAEDGREFVHNIFVLPEFLRSDMVSSSSKFKVVALIVFVVGYFLSGVDIMPELFMGIFGFADDIAVILICIKSINKEIDKFAEIKYNHRRKRDTVIDADYDIK